MYERSWMPLFPEIDCQEKLWSRVFVIESVPASLQADVFCTFKQEMVVATHDMCSYLWKLTSTRKLYLNDMVAKRCSKRKS